MIGPFVSRSSIQAKVRTSTLIQSGRSTQPNRSARQPDVRRVRASAIGKAISERDRRDDERDDDRVPEHLAVDLVLQEFRIGGERARRR